MSELSKNPITVVDSRGVSTGTKSSRLLERQRRLESALENVKKDSADFYGLAARSLGELNTSIKAIQEKMTEV